LNRPIAFALAVGALTIGAAGLRVWGLEYGIPHPVARPDEELVVGKSLQMSLGRALSPGDFNYPHLVFDVDALALAAYRYAGLVTGRYSTTEDFLVDVAVRRPGLQYRICRGVTVAFGVATVFAAGLAAFQAYGRRSVALLAALLVAVNFLHARDSHYGTVDIPMTFFVTLSLAFGLGAARTQARRDYLLAGLFAGLATSAKYNAGTVVVGVLVAALPRLWRPAGPAERRSAVASLLVSGAAMAAAFAATSPACVVHFDQVVKGLVVQKEALFSSPGAPAWITHLTVTLPGAFGWPGCVAALAGVAHALWRRRTADVLFLAFLGPTFASMATMTWVLGRYTLPMIPPLAILAAEVVLAGLPHAGRLTATLAAAVLALPPLVSILKYDQLAARPDTRLLAAEWISEHLAPRSRLLVCRGYGAPAINDDHRRPPAFKPEVIPCKVDAIRGAGVRYLVTHDHPYVYYGRPTDDVRAWLAANARAEVVFDPFVKASRVKPYFYSGDAFYLPYSGFDAVERGGPVITVWDLETNGRDASAETRP
jgi:Dolichyl-phosphate-mannose-protein mannosyltransferase